jgi:hypothetical protein
MHKKEKGAKSSEELEGEQPALPQGTVSALRR